MEENLASKFSIKFYANEASGIEIVVCRNTDFAYPIHSHISTFVIGFVLAGSITVDFGKKKRLCPKGEAFLIKPYEPHRIDATGHYSLLSVCINANIIKGNNPQKLKEHLNELLRLVLMELPDLAAVDFLPLFALLGSLQDFRPTAVENENFAAIRQKMEATPEENISLDAMAKAAHFSKFNFLRQFKKEIGLTPHQFLIQMRVRKAKKLLTQTLTVAEASAAAGFFDQSHFVRQFSKIVHLAPTVYKKARKDY